MNDWQIMEQKLKKKKSRVFFLCYCPLHVEFRGYKKAKQSLYKPEQAVRFKEVEAPRFNQNRHTKVIRLSALRRLYSP